MSGLRNLQEHPHFLEFCYEWTRRLMLPFRHWLKPGTSAEYFFVHTEEVVKGAVFDCRMCGQCVLHRTGMTCPMTCPKNLRNGPCGGVREDGNCEVHAEQRCVWIEAWERSKRMPLYGHEILNVVPPLDRTLQGHSAWIYEISNEAASASR